MKRNWRLFYPAGAISLILLPIICICYLKTNRAAQPLYAMDVVVYNPSTEVDSSLSLSFQKIPSLRIYHSYLLTGANEVDKQILNNVKKEIGQIIKSNDTTRGIVLEFGNHSKYWSWVKGFDIVNQNHANFWGINNLIYIYHQAPDTRILPLPQIFTCGTGIMFQEKMASEERRHEQFEYYHAIAKSMILPFLFFLIMCYFTFRTLYLSIKN